MKHLRDANMSYWQHWLHATKIGLSLLIHAWFPGLLTTYASDHLCKKPQKDSNWEDDDWDNWWGEYGI